MHRMGPAPGQQEARAGEVSGREKQGGAYGRPHAGAHKQRGTRGRAVAARARAKSGPETAISEQNLTSIKIQEGTPLDELNSGTPAARNRSGPSSAAARCHGRPGPGPGGAAAQPNIGTCEICSTFATLLQKLQHTRLTALCDNISFPLNNDTHFCRGTHLWVVRCFGRRSHKGCYLHFS